MPTTLAEQKQAIRDAILPRIPRLPLPLLSMCHQKVRLNIASLLKELQCERPALFVPLREEPNILPLIEARYQAGQLCLLPVVLSAQEPLQFKHYQGKDTLIKHALGFMQSGPDAPSAEPDILLVPLAAYDLKGYRIGRGGGYYDRTIAQLRRARPEIPVFGVGLTCQKIPAIPTEPHDEKLDGIVHEDAILRF